MTTRSPLPQLRPNIDLIEFEREVANVLGGSGGGSALQKAAAAIERHGCDSDLVSSHGARGRTPVDVIALDLAWLSPGPTGTWSENGKQVCCCLSAPAHEPSGSGTWYQRALDRYFKTPPGRSLLSFQDVYTRPAFVQMRWLNDHFEPEKRSPGPDPSMQPIYTSWQASFRPEPETDQSVTNWGSRFQVYKTLMLEELTSELGGSYAENAILAWVYVSSGTQKEATLPPLWAASMFLLFRFPGLEPPYDKSLDVLLSNLLNTLQTAGQRALEAGRVKRSLAQVLSHEFKNLNQDVAVLSELLRAAYLALPPSTRKQHMSTFKLRLDALHLAAQATTAFSKAAYWLAAPRLDGIELRPDPECRVFRWILYLAIHLIAASRSTWQLVGIPPIGEVLLFLKKEYGQSEATPASGLLDDLSISLMLFFALEPVRNVRGVQPVRPTVELGVDVSSNEVRLLQTTYEPDPSTDSIPSVAVETLMQAIRDNADWLGPFIEIDSIVRANSYGTEVPNVFRVQRITTIRVHRIPYPKHSNAGEDTKS